jgi:uncharacterized protein
MMQLTLDSQAGINTISAVSPGEIRIGERRIRSSVLVGVRDIIADWPVPAISNVDAAAMDAIFALEPEIVILGTGRTLVFPDAGIGALALSKNIGMEVMDTAAACRTFNILASEGRQVVAGLVIE